MVFLIQFLYTLSMILIRPAQLSDAPQLADLVKLFSTVDTSEKQIKTRMINMQTTEKVIVAEDDNKLIGFGSLRLVHFFSDDFLYAEVTDLFVHPDFRRLQVAKQIMAFITKICSEKKVPQIVLITGFDNIGAQGFYKSIGYQNWALAMKKQL